MRTKGTASEYDEIIEQYLADCYAQHTSARVSELAALMKIHRSHLSKILCRTFGKSPQRILRERRLDEACRLLRLTPLTVDQIALASAFGTSTTLYRLFRKAFGMTPDQYRLAARSTTK